jgi:hypothetical protein
VSIHALFTGSNNQLLRVKLTSQAAGLVAIDHPKTGKAIERDIALAERLPLLAVDAIDASQGRALQQRCLKRLVAFVKVSPSHVLNTAEAALHEEGPEDAANLLTLVRERPDVRTARQDAFGREANKPQPSTARHNSSIIQVAPDRSSAPITRDGLLAQLEKARGFLRNWLLS